MTIKPNEEHVIKAVAWDALKAACDIEVVAGDEIRSKIYQKLGELMGALLNDTAEKLSDPNTWRKHNGESEST